MSIKHSTDLWLLVLAKLVFTVQWSISVREMVGRSDGGAGVE